MSKTVADWLHGWTQSHIPNDDVAKVWAEQFLKHKVTRPNFPLTSSVRNELENEFTPPTSGDPTFMEVVKDAMGDHLTAIEVEEYALPFVEMMREEFSWLPLGVDIRNDPLPPVLAKEIRWSVEQNWTEERVEAFRSSN